MPALSADVFSSAGGAVSDLFGAFGSFAEAGAYKTAQKISLQNANLAAQSTRVKQLQASRQTLRVLGGQQADIAGAGLAASGSALDVMHSSIQEAALTKQLVSAQGQIDVNTYNQQAAAYAGQATAAKASGIGSLIGGALKAGAALLAISDRRLKRNIEYVYTRLDGIRVYDFDYIHQLHIPNRWRGVMAQEVLEIRPDAVALDRGDGYLRVDYEALGMEMRAVRYA